MASNKTYEVTLSANVMTVVPVEARDKEAAERRALRMANDDMISDWEFFDDEDIKAIHIESSGGVATKSAASKAASTKSGNRSSKSKTKRTNSKALSSNRNPTKKG